MKKAIFFCGKVPEHLVDCGAEEVIAHVTRTPPRFALMPWARRALVMVSVKGSADAIAKAQSVIPDLRAAYMVEESIPIVRPVKDLPAATMLTLLRKKKRISRDRFFEEWFGKHTKMAMEIHPMRGYVRNVVTSTLKDGSPPWDGIVVEDFMKEADLLTMRGLFKPPMVSNMLRAGVHLAGFLDLLKIQIYLVAEERIVG